MSNTTAKTVSPSRFAGEHELLELTGALGEAGKGVFMLTKGMNTTVPWFEDVAARNGRPVMIAAMFIDPNDPERVVREFGEIETARPCGRELWGQVGCYPLGMEFTLSLPYPLHAMISWHPAMEALNTDRHLKLFANRSFRETVKAEALTRGVPVRFSITPSTNAYAGHAKPEIQIAYRQRGCGARARGGQGSL